MKIIHFLKPDEFIVRDNGTIYTVLGSCVAITLWDTVNKIGGMVHYRLPKKVNHGSGMKSGEELTNSMYKELLRKGANPDLMIAHITGGVLSKSTIGKRIVEENVEYAEKFTAENNIKVKKAFTRNEFPLKIKFQIETGEMLIDELHG